MYSVLIVDDEIVILEGIKEVILSAELPLKEVKTALSAQEAISMFQKTPFDIILSDISMPEMDGLTMIQETRKLWPSTAVIILTGYQNFEYAREALRLGSMDYLLKPVTDEQLINSFKTVINNLDQGWFRRFYEKELWRQVDNELTMEQRSYLLCVMQQKSTLAITQEKLHSLKIPMQVGEKVRAIVVHYDGISIGQSVETERKPHYWLLNILQNIMYGYEKVFGFQYDSNSSVFLLQPMSEQILDNTTLYKEIEEMQSYFFEKIDTIISIGILYSIDWKDWVNGVFEIIYRQEETRDLGQLFCVDHNTYVKEVMETATEGENCNFFVQRIQEYIRNHVNEDLSLSLLSDKFHINPSYLSRMFHKESGLQLSVFIAEVRIEKAKKLLKYSDVKIYEIAEKVGFDTAGYFTKVFNKIVGISPKEYRMLEVKNSIE